MYMLLIPAIKVLIYLVDNDEVPLFTVRHCFTPFNTLIYAIFTEINEGNASMEDNKANVPGILL